MLKITPFANALAVVMGVLYIVCRLLVGIAPDLFRSIAQSWFHGYDLSAIPAGSTTFGGFLLGLITAVLATWLFGYFFAWVYNKLSKSK